MSFYNGVRITHQEVSGVEVGSPLDWLEGFVSKSFFISPFPVVVIRSIKEQTGVFVKLIGYCLIADCCSKNTINRVGYQ